MEELFGQLRKIDDLLEQIATITSNQTTVLLQPSDEDEEQLTLIESMVEYKEELINQLQLVEKQFDEGYKQKRELLTNKECVIQFKECVAKILEKKQQIQEMEQNNLRIMQNRSSRGVKRMDILKAPQDVVAAYKKQQSKS